MARIRKIPVMERLCEELRNLPGVGTKSSVRIAFHILEMDNERVQSLVNAILDAKTAMKFCDQCFNFSDSNPCSICASPERDHKTICVVEQPRDIMPFEQMEDYHGVYHVLHGTISPMYGASSEQIKFAELVSRVVKDDVQEVIVATNSNVDGEATALYIAKILQPFNIRVTRIAHGIPVGGELEHADSNTLSKAMENRREIILSSSEE